MTILFFMSCLGLGALGAWAIARVAERLGLIDVPNERSSHRQVTPKGGGIGILGAFILSSVFAGLGVLVWIPLAVIAVLSFVGDRVGFSPKVRLLAQFVFVGALVITAKPIGQVDFFGVVFLLFWVVFISGTANFFNFMDGINGIAGMTGVVGFGLLAWYLRAYGAGETSSSVAIALSLASLGFLPFNMPRARVFMGDVGSILLGAAFSTLIFMAELHSKVDPDALVDSLGVAEKQMVEIAKALIHDSKILIMDEPTTVLTKEEIDVLFSRIRQLKDKEVSIIFISHKLGEIREICDRVLILRDGDHISTDPAEIH